jgi:hypothetical protein
MSPSRESFNLVLIVGIHYFLMEERNIAGASRLSAVRSVCATNYVAVDHMNSRRDFALGEPLDNIVKGVLPPATRIHKECARRVATALALSLDRPRVKTEDPANGRWAPVVRDNWIYQESTPIHARPVHPLRMTVNLVFCSQCKQYSIARWGWGWEVWDSGGMMKRH